jgi:hypothetical protein
LLTCFPFPFSTITTKEKEMKKKAQEGLKTAIDRVRAKKQEVWWNLQTTEYRLQAARKKRTLAFTDAKFKERKDLLHKALFHCWSPKELEEWIKTAIVNYYQLIVNYRNETDKNKPKKPEIYISRIIAEVFGPFDSFLIGKMIGSLGYIYQEEARLEAEKLKKAKEDLLKKNAHVRLAGKSSEGGNGRRFSLPTLTKNANSAPAVNVDDEEVSILGRPIQEKIDFCIRAIAITLAKLYTKDYDGITLIKVNNIQLWFNFNFLFR